VPVNSQTPGEILDYIGTHSGEQAEGYGVSQAELATYFAFNRCSMSRPLSTLVVKGWLKAHRAPVRGGHRKQLVYELTDRGRAHLTRQTRNVPLLGNEFPPAPNPFSGRAPELRELLQYSRQGGGVVFIEGPSGIGKTSLISRHIRRLRTGRVLHWFTVRPGIAPHHFVTSLAHALAPLKSAPQIAYYAQLPRQPVGREVADLAARALGDRELVVVIDNVHAAESDMRKFLTEFLTAFLKDRHDHVFCIGQTAPILTPEQGIPTFRLTVSGLDRKAALDLTDRLGGLADRFESVYKSCLGSPFLLKLAVSNPDLEATEAALPAAVVTRLPDPIFRALVPLALANEPLPVSVLQEMGLETEERVEELVRSGLLRNTAEGRVEILQIVRVALIERGGPTLERVGHLRLAEYYGRSRRTESIRERFLHLVAGEAFQEAVEIISTHERTILNVGYSDALRASVRHLSLALPSGPQRVTVLRAEAALLQLHAEYTDSILSLRRAIVESTEDRAIAADCLLRIVDLYLRQSNLDQAQAAMDQARKLGPFAKRVAAFMLLSEARITEAQANWVRAQALAREAFIMAQGEHPPDVALESIALWSKLAVLGADPAGALALIEQGLDAARQASRLDIVFNLMLVRARVHSERGDAALAQSEMRKMRVEAEALGYLGPLTYTLGGLSALAFQAERWEEGLAYARQAVSLAERLGNHLVQGHTLAIMATSEMQMALKRNDKSLMIAAREHAERGVSILQKIRLTDSLALAYGYLADVYLGMDLVPEAVDACRQALRLGAELGLKWLIDQIRSDLLVRLEAAGGKV
jgi:tetratricopeptide (TPR) repeat protein/DNA-binding PadR family transcriptional regulator